MNRNVIWIDENENDLEEVSLARAHEEGLLHRISVVYLTADKRELEEELGVVNVELKEVGFCSSNEASGKIKHKFKVFQHQGNPGKLNPEEVAGVFWADPKEIWNDMQKDDKDEKYCGGFKGTLELYLKTPLNLR